MPPRKRTKTPKRNSSSKSAAARDDRTDANDDQHLRGLFDQIDTDGSGEIDFDELCKNAEVFGMGALPTGKLRSVFDAADTDGSGSISFSEFCRAVKNGRTTNDFWANAETSKLLKTISGSARSRSRKATKNLETVASFRHSYKVQPEGCCQIGNCCTSADIGLANAAWVLPDVYFVSTGNGQEVEGRYSKEPWQCCACKPPAHQIVVDAGVGHAINMSNVPSCCSCYPTHWEVLNTGKHGGDVIARVTRPTCCNPMYRVTDAEWNDKFFLDAERCCFGLCFKRTHQDCCRCSQNSVWQRNFNVLDASDSRIVGNVAFGGGKIDLPFWLQGLGAIIGATTLVTGGIALAGRRPELASYMATTHITDSSMSEEDRARVQALVYAIDAEYFVPFYKPRKCILCGCGRQDFTNHWKEFTKQHKQFPDLDRELSVGYMNGAPRPSSMER